MANSSATPFSTLKSVVLLTNTITGVAFLSMPFRFKQSGIVGTPVSFLIVIFYQLISLELMLRSWLKGSFDEKDTSSHPKEVDLRDRIYLLVGRSFGLLYDLFVSLSCFGALIAFTMAMADAMAPLIVEVRIVDESDSNSTLARFVVISIFSVLQYPLTAFVTFSSQSSGAVVSLTLLMGIGISILVNYLNDVASGSIPCCPSVNESPGIFTTIPATIATLTFAYTCQMNAFYVYNDLLASKLLAWKEADKEKGPIVRGNFKNQIKAQLRKVNIISVITATILYLLIGVFGYLNFLDDTNSNILNNYSVYSGPGIVSRLFLVLKMLLTYPLIAAPLEESVRGGFSELFSTTDETKNKKPTVKDPQNRRSALAVLVLIAAASGIATFARDLSFVFSLVGSVTDLFLSYILPPILINYSTALNVYLTRTSAINLTIMMAGAMVISELSIGGLFLGRT